MLRQILFFVVRAGLVWFGVGVLDSSFSDRNGPFLGRRGESKDDGRAWLGCWILGRVLARAGSVCPCGRVVPVGRSLHPIRVCGKLTAFRDVASLWSPSCCGKWARRAEWSGVLQRFRHATTNDWTASRCFVSFLIFTRFSRTGSNTRDACPHTQPMGFVVMFPHPSSTYPRRRCAHEAQPAASPQPLFRGRASPTPMPLLAQE